MKHTDNKQEFNLTASGTALPEEVVVTIAQSLSIQETARAVSTHTVWYRYLQQSLKQKQEQKKRVNAAQDWFKADFPKVFSFLSQQTAVDWLACYQALQPQGSNLVTYDPAKLPPVLKAALADQLNNDKDRNLVGKIINSRLEDSDRVLAIFWSENDPFKSEAHWLKVQWFHNTARYNHPIIARLLLQTGINVNVAVSDWTALDLAMHYDNFNMVKLLCEWGASLTQDSFIRMPSDVSSELEDYITAVAVRQGILTPKRCCRVM